MKIENHKIFNHFLHRQFLLSLFYFFILERNKFYGTSLKMILYSIRYVFYM